MSSSLSVDVPDWGDEGLDWNTLPTKPTPTASAAGGSRNWEEIAAAASERKKQERKERQKRKKAVEHEDDGACDQRPSKTHAAAPADASAPLPRAPGCTKKDGAKEKVEQVKRQEVQKEKEQKEHKKEEPKVQKQEKQQPKQEKESKKQQPPKQEPKEPKEDQKQEPKKQDKQQAQGKQEPKTQEKMKKEQPPQQKQQPRQQKPQQQQEQKLPKLSKKNDKREHPEDDDGQSAGASGPQAKRSFEETADMFTGKNLFAKSGKGIQGVVVPESEGAVKGAQGKKKKGKPTAEERLQGARFRMLNEKLYTTTGNEAYTLFQSNPSLFSVYHDGFKSQVERWPVNPVDKIIEYLAKRDSKLVVADFGCGEARIAASIPNKVHSFDLVACNSRVTACDMAHVPIRKGCVDIAVFCLSLMGTNFIDYLREAHRVLQPGGTLLVAEVKSRILKVQAFINVVECLGFDFVSQDPSNKMFIEFEFTKNSQRVRDVDPQAVTDLLQPCIYKRR